MDKTATYEPTAEDLVALCELVGRPDLAPQARAFAERRSGNIGPIIRTFGKWAGGDFTSCVSKLRGKKGISNPDRLCAWLKDRNKGTTYWRGKGHKGRVHAPARRASEWGDEESAVSRQAAEGDPKSRDAYAYTPTDNPSDWKLRIDDAGHVGGAAAAIGKGFRGQKADIPASALPGVKAKIRRAWRKFHPDESPDAMPEAIKAAEPLPADVGGDGGAKKPNKAKVHTFKDANKDGKCDVCGQTEAGGMHKRELVPGRGFGAVKKAAEGDMGDEGPSVDDLEEIDSSMPTGYMVALYIDAGAAEELARDGGEPAEDLHVTLAYCGDSEEYDALAKARALIGLSRTAEITRPLSGRTGGLARFANDDQDVLVATADVVGLAELRERVRNVLEGAGIQISDEHGFTPHITLEYLDPEDKTPLDRLEPVDIHMAYLTVADGPDQVDFPFRDSADGIAPSPYTEPDEDEIAALVESYGETVSEPVLEALRFAASKFVKWQEQDHPRGDGGVFASSPGGGGSDAGNEKIKDAGIKVGKGAPPDTAGSIKDAGRDAWKTKKVEQMTPEEKGRAANIEALRLGLEESGASLQGIDIPDDSAEKVGKQIRSLQASAAKSKGSKITKMELDEVLDKDGDTVLGVKVHHADGKVDTLPIPKTGDKAEGQNRSDEQLAQDAVKREKYHAAQARAKKSAPPASFRPQQPEQPGGYTQVRATEPRFDIIPGHQLFMELPAEFAEPPEWFPYLPRPGSYAHPRYGTVVVTPARNRRFVDNFKAGIYQTRLPIDAEHQTKVSGALGWITDMRMVEDGSVEARADWTSRGRSMLEDNRFAFFSPEWFDEWPDPLTGHRHTDIAIGGALTGRPYFKEGSLRPLVARAAGELWAYDDTGQHPELLEAGEAGEEETMSIDPQRFAEMEEQLEQMQEELARRTASEEAAATQAKTMSEQVIRLTGEARLRRFTDEVTGKSSANGQPWIGEFDKHVAFMEKLASQFGEDSEELKHYVEMNRGHAKQAREGSLFRPQGGGGGGNVPPAYERIEAKARQMVEADATGKLTFEQAMDRVAMREPQLYHEYNEELEAAKHTRRS